MAPIPKFALLHIELQQLLSFHPIKSKKQLSYKLSINLFVLNLQNKALRWVYYTFIVKIYYMGMSSVDDGGKCVISKA